MPHNANVDAVEKLFFHKDEWPDVLVTCRSHVLAYVTAVGSVLPHERAAETGHHDANKWSGAMRVYGQFCADFSSAVPLK